MTTTAPAPPVPGPSATDTDLAAWRDAVAGGQLPTPHTERWQQLRSGVVNLWEFDTAEYWLADGRAQLVGQNQSGKSTLMALTTLILLTGKLNPGNLDTFGGSAKHFRYYVEPSDDPADRRETGSDLHRGWAWAEYGRLVDGQADFYTTLLFTQSRRGRTALSNSWLTCHGPARVGAELTLSTGAEATPSTELALVDGVVVASDGADYQARVSRELFGFDSAARLDAVTTMLKLLRIPKLGTSLDPQKVTDKMRAALPEIADSEITQLAESWDELDQIRTDRDSAAAAKDAVTAFVRKAWQPWAKAVLLRSAHDLTAAQTQFDDVTREETAAGRTLAQAETEQARLDRVVADGEAIETQVDLDLQGHLASRGYRDAVAANANIAGLEREVATADSLLTDASKAAAAATERSTSTAWTAQTSATELAEAQAAVDTALQSAAVAVPPTGLPELTVQWLRDGDLQRTQGVVGERRARLSTARKRLEAHTAAVQEEERVQEHHNAATRHVGDRTATCVRHEESRTAALQTLSATLERWVLQLPNGDAPTPDTRTRWIDAVTDQALSPAPSAVLGTLVRDEWLDPRVRVLEGEASQQRQLAVTAEQVAQKLLAQIRDLQAAPTPQPEAPTLWSRRDRPRPGGDGAPLWLLLDPNDDLDAPSLGHIEAALAAMGLLDAWVTPDEAYRVERDGADVVVELTGGVPASQGQTLAAALHPSSDAGSLGPTVHALLARIRYAPAGLPIPVTRSGTAALTGDGRWTAEVTSGTADSGAHGAELLGTTARAQARARRIAELEAQRALQVAAATEHAAAVATLEATIAEKRQQARMAPSDATVVTAGRDCHHAAAELLEARDALASVTTLLSAAQERTQATLTVFTEFAVEHSLPRNAAGLRTLSSQLDTFDRAISMVKDTSAAAVYAANTHTTHAQVAADASKVANTAAEQLSGARRRHSDAGHALDAAHDARGATDAQILDAVRVLKSDLLKQKGAVKKYREQAKEQVSTVTAARGTLNRTEGDREVAEQRRGAAEATWWSVTDAGLLTATDLDTVDPSARSLRQALGQARPYRSDTKLRDWPDTTTGRDQYVARAQQAMTIGGLRSLRAVLESSGGRTVDVVDRPDGGTLPDVRIRVDSTGVQLEPRAALRALDDQVARLNVDHNAKLDAVIQDLLHSTFIDHLRDRLLTVIDLLTSVNKILALHPTGANGTVLRLDRRAAEGQQAAYDVLQVLARRLPDSDDVQDQMKVFLQQQIGAAQELGRVSGTGEWKSHLTKLLDYRDWFDVVIHHKVGPGSGFKPLTREAHARDSGGGKVVTLLQPLIATLVALYGRSPTAPRPLWLDEAFSGVDDSNLSTMLGLLVDFELDFLLAGPSAVVATSSVPSAAAWFVTRAPAPHAGVHLDLALWTGQMTYLVVPTAGLGYAGRKAVASAEPDLFGGEG